MPERGFLPFWIFLLFFSEFSCRGRVWMEFRTKIFSLSFSASLSPFWIEIKPELSFLIFWIFLLFCLEFYYPGRVNGIRDKNFFLSFPGYHIPFQLKIMLDRGFLIFWIFLLFFSEYSSPGRVWMEFRSKIFFSLSQPISTRFG